MQVLIQTPAGVTRTIQGTPYLAGLAWHKSAKYDGLHLYSITHIHSGLLILDGVAKSNLRRIAPTLNSVNWDVSARVVFNDDSYKVCTGKAAKMAKDRRTTFPRAREATVAKDVGGRTQPGSGSVPHYKRDVVTPKLLIEMKTTLSGSKVTDLFRVEFKDMEFLRKQALEQGKMPVYLVEFCGEDGFVLIPSEEFELEDDRIQWTDMDLTEKLGITIKREMADELGAFGYLYISTPTRDWVGMNYTNFLSSVKE